MTTNTSSSDANILSKLTVPLYGLSVSTHNEFTGHRYPLGLSMPKVIRSDLSQGLGTELMSRKPPHVVSSLAHSSVELSGLIQTQFRRRLDLKLYTATIANRSQKKPMRKATWTKSGAAFFKLRKIIDIPLVMFNSRRIRRELSILNTYIFLVCST